MLIHTKRKSATVHFPHQNSILTTSQPIIPRDMLKLVQISVLNTYILTQQKTEVLKLLAPILSSDTDYINDPEPLFLRILRYKSEFSAGSFAISASPSPPKTQTNPFQTTENYGTSKVSFLLNKCTPQLNSSIMTVLCP